jgi:hypothetical protein
VGCSSRPNSATLASNPHPYIANQVYSRELAGGSVILPSSAVGRVNASQGLDALGLDYAVEQMRWTDLTALRLLPLIPESLRPWLGGFRLNSLNPNSSAAIPTYWRVPQICTCVLPIAAS